MVANRAFSEHPYLPPGDGAHFVDLVYRALAASPEVFAVTADADSTWSRRYTGHIETGAASISG
ncbi:hypothetical protein [Streptomyces sp. NBC_01589]|uniref:hypothetical protein n=1 Tax=unclassified Streptomyces TaxID=2593676 RepID=UPI0038673754